MKFSSAKLTALVLALPALAAANPTPISPAIIQRAEAECSTGPIQCCESVQEAGNPAVSIILALLGLVIDGLNIPIGITCSPITVIGGGGTQCEAKPVCCQNNAVGGLISIGCLPININI